MGRLLAGVLLKFKVLFNK